MWGEGKTAYRRFMLTILAVLRRVLSLPKRQYAIYQSGFGSLTHSA